MDRKFYIIIAAAIVICISAALLSNASSGATDGSDGTFISGDLNYEILTAGEDDEPGTAMVTGVYEETSETLTIPDEVYDGDGKRYIVSTIDSMATCYVFYKTVVIGNNVKTVKDLNFCDCPNLEEITIGDNIDTIGDEVFTLCPSLKTFNTNGNPNFDIEGNILYFQHSVCVTAIGVIENSVAVRSGTTSIGCSAFEKQDKMTTIYLPKTVNVIEYSCFKNCVSLQCIYSNNDTTKSSLPSSLMIIGVESFCNCPSLVLTDLPENIRMINYCAFQGCSSLETIHLDYLVAFVGNGAFSCCANLREITVDELNTTYYSLDGVLYKQESKNEVGMLVQYPQGRTAENGTFTFPNDTVSIESDAFCFDSTKPSSLQYVVIPSELQEMSPNAFKDCFSLKEITVPGSVDSIDYQVFCGCTSLEKVVLQEGIKEIFMFAFYGCTSLREISLPGSMTEIECRSFEGCTSLTEVTIPSGVKTLESYTFALCYGLKQATVENRDITFEESCFATGDVDHLTQVNVIVPRGCSVPDSAFIDQGTTYTDHSVSYIGEKPYPYENWIAIAICAVLMVLILRFIRRV